MLKGRALVRGDRVALVSPASPCGRPEFDRGVQAIKDLGFEPTWEETVFARDGYVAGPASVRAKAFLQAWQDPSVAALIAVRGGFGSVQLLPALDPSLLRRTPKPFIGYSDTTSLLTWLTGGCGIVAFHGPMVEGRLSRGKEGFDVASFRAALHAAPPGNLEPSGVSIIQTGEAAGVLVGGTLTQLASSLGTPYAFQPPEGSVLFIEDVNERPYRIDRMLTQLRLAGALSRVQGIVWGEMPGCDEPGGVPAVRDVVRSALNGFSGPVLFGFPSGHTVGPCWTLPLGVKVRLIARGQPRLTVEEAAVT